MVNTLQTARFISLRVRTAVIAHGFDANNREIEETAETTEFVEKLIAIERIQSITERYLLVNGQNGRQMYWEYEGGFEALKARLMATGLIF